MRKVLLFVVFTVFMVMGPCAPGARAEVFDAAAEYVCGEAGAGVWSYDAYRASDGAYMPMAFGRVELKEVTKYGIDAHYAPDSGQPGHPFLTVFPEGLWGSPATEGERFDAALGFSAPRAGGARVSGFARYLGSFSGERGPGGVKVELLLGKEVLWERVITGGEAHEFDFKAALRAGDSVRLRISDAGGGGYKLTAFNMRVEMAE